MISNIRNLSTANMESKDVQSGGSKISGHSEFSPNKTPVAAVNADSTTNAQGEFHPSKPKEPPIATSGVSFASLHLLPLHH